MNVNKIKIRIEELIDELEEQTENRHMNDYEQGRYNTLIEVLELIDEI